MCLLILSYSALKVKNAKGRFMKYLTSYSMTRFLLSLLIVCLSHACRRDPAINIPPPNLEQLYGTWDWVITSGGLAGLTITPASEGVTRSIKFEANGQYTSFQNTELADQSYYVLRENTTYVTGKTIYFVDYISSGKKSEAKFHINEYIQFIGPDTLILSQAYISDGFASVYVRK